MCTIKLGTALPLFAPLKQNSGRSRLSFIAGHAMVSFLRFPPWHLSHGLVLIQIPAPYTSSLSLLSFYRNKYWFLEDAFWGGVFWSFRRQEFTSKFQTPEADLGNSTAVPKRSTEKTLLAVPPSQEPVPEGGWVLKVALPGWHLGLGEEL